MTNIVFLVLFSVSAQVLFTLSFHFFDTKKLVYPFFNWELFSEELEEEIEFRFLVYRLNDQFFTTPVDLGRVLPKGFLRPEVVDNYHRQLFFETDRFTQEVKVGAANELAQYVFQNACIVDFSLEAKVYDLRSPPFVIDELKVGEVRESHRILYQRESCR